MSRRTPREKHSRHHHTHGHTRQRTTKRHADQPSSIWSDLSKKWFRNITA